jgi:hypothetical protein
MLRAIHSKIRCTMRHYFYQLFFLFLIMMTLSSCRKNKEECVGDKFSIQPFVERYGVFYCGDNDSEFTHIARRKCQIDSLTNCSFSPPVALPIDETNMVYIAFGKLSYHHKDTLTTIIMKDSCSKKLTYDISMIQRDTTTLCCPEGISVVRNIFCSVSEIPTDYQVEVKYKYVPLE